jgi:hypothetical protein
VTDCGAGRSLNEWHPSVSVGSLLLAKGRSLRQSRACAPVLIEPQTRYTLGPSPSLAITRRLDTTTYLQSITTIRRHILHLHLIHLRIHVPKHRPPRPRNDPVDPRRVLWQADSSVSPNPSLPTLGLGRITSIQLHPFDRPLFPLFTANARYLIPPIRRHVAVQAKAIQG